MAFPGLSDSFAGDNISADVVAGCGIGLAGDGHIHIVCAADAHIEYLILLSVRCDLQRICRGVAVDLVHILFQAQLVFCHVNSVGNAHIAEGIAAAVLAGLFFLAVRIAHHKAVLCGVFSDPAVLRIFLRIIIVRSAVSEVDLQIKASAAVIVGCAAFEVGAAVCIPCILVCLVPIAAEYLHSAQSGLFFKCRHHLVQMLDRLSVQLDFHIADAVGTVPVLIDTFEFRVASGEIVGVIFVNKDQIALVHALGSQCDLLAVGQTAFLCLRCLCGVRSHIRCVGLGILFAVFNLFGRSSRCCHRCAAGLLRGLPALAAVETQCADQQDDQQKRYAHRSDAVQPELAFSGVAASFSGCFFIHIRFRGWFFCMTDRFFRFAHDRCSFLCRIAASAPAVHFLRTISRRSVQIRNPFRSGCGSAFIIPYSPKIFKSNFVVSGKAVSRRSAGACLSDTPAGEPQQGSRFLHPHFHLTKPGKRGILSCTFFPTDILRMW